MFGGIPRSMFVRDTRSRRKQIVQPLRSQPFERLEPRLALAVTTAPDVFTLNEDTILDLAATQTLIPRNSIWKYTASDGDITQLDPDFNTTWQTQSILGNSYDGPHFAVGPGPLVYGGVDGLEPVTILGSLVDFGSQLGLPDTAYFVQTFEYSGNPANVSRLFVDAIIDDGAVFYLNGQEVGRYNMGEQADTFAARAVRTGNEGRFEQFDLANRLVPGTNVFALSVHNVNFQGADFGFGLSLHVTEDRGNVLANDTSDLTPPASQLHVTAINGHPIASEPIAVATTHGSVTMRPDGTFRYTPAANYHGTDSFMYVAADAEGESAPTMITLQIASVNDIPDAIDDAYTLAEDTSFFSEVQRAPNWLLPVGSQWDYFDELTNGFTTGIFGGEPTPEEDYPRDAAGRAWYEVDFVIASSDAVIGPWKTSNAPFEQGGIRAFEDPSLNLPPLTILSNAAHSNTTDLFRTQFTLTEAQAAAEWLWVFGLFDDGGILYVNGHEVKRWAMQNGPIGTRTLATASSGDLIYDVDESINVAGLLHAGENKFAFELHQSGINSSDRGFDFWLSLADRDARGIAANDTDIENSPLTVQLVTPPEHGELELEANGQFRYTPNTDYFGEDSFTYTVTDMGTPPATSTPATVRLTITPVNDTLSAHADYYDLDEDTSLSGNFLENDSTEDGPLQVTSVTAAAHGTVSHDEAGNFVYVPHADFFGDDSFTYTVRDAVDDTATVRVDITVRPVNDAPTNGAPHDFFGREDQPLVIASAPIGLANFLSLTATWRYNQSIAAATPTTPPGDYPTDPTNPDAAWYAPQFSTTNSSSPWSAAAAPFAVGHIGYLSGEANITTLANRGINTTLFRTTFALSPEQARAAPRLRLNALIDDGGVFYLNGHEIVRVNLPENVPIDANTLATAFGEESPKTYWFDAGGLVVPGENVLAFELHQGPTSLVEIVDHVRITEIMYHPGDPTAAEIAAGFDEDNDFEFIEIANLSDRHTIDLTDVEFVTGITFNFDGLSLAPNERAVVVANLPAFRARYGNGPRVLGAYQGSLSNAGEQLLLMAPSGILAGFTYGDDNVEGWPADADGDGNSLVAVNPTAPYDAWGSPNRWRSSTNIGGSPSAADPGDSIALSSDDLAFAASLDITFPGGLLEGAGDVEGDTVTAIIVSPPANGSLVAASDGSFAYTPNRNFFGIDTFTYVLVDNAGTPGTSEPIVATIHVTPDSPGVSCEDLDWNKNGIVDGGDVVGIADRYGADVAEGSEADFDANGTVGLSDLIRLKNALGQNCNSSSAPSAVIQATHVDAVFNRGAPSDDSSVAVRNRRLAIAAEARVIARKAPTEPSAAMSNATTPRTLNAPSARRTFRKFVADRADELI